MTDITLNDLRDHYESVGSLLRRKDASVEKHSPVLDAADVLKIALAERAAVDAVATKRVYGGDESGWSEPDEYGPYGYSIDAVIVKNYDPNLTLSLAHLRDLAGVPPVFAVYCQGDAHDTILPPGVPVRVAGKRLYTVPPSDFTQEDMDKHKAALAQLEKKP